MSVLLKLQELEIEKMEKKVKKLENRVHTTSLSFKEIDEIEERIKKLNDMINNSKESHLNKINNGRI